MGGSGNVGNKSVVPRKGESKAQEWSTQPSAHPEKGLLPLNQLNKMSNGTTDIVIVSRDLSAKRRFRSSRGDVGPLPDLLHQLSAHRRPRLEKVVMPSGQRRGLWRRLGPVSSMEASWLTPGGHVPCLTGPARLVSTSLQDVGWSATCALRCTCLHLESEEEKSTLLLASLHSSDECLTQDGFPTSSHWV